jgi:hypothetical protein
VGVPAGKIWSDLKADRRLLRNCPSLSTSRFTMGAVTRAKRHGNHNGVVLPSICTGIVPCIRIITFSGYYVELIRRDAGLGRGGESERCSLSRNPGLTCASRLSTGAGGDLVEASYGRYTAGCGDRSATVVATTLGEGPAAPQARAAAGDRGERPARPRRRWLRNHPRSPVWAHRHVLHPRTAGRHAHHHGPARDRRVTNSLGQGPARPVPASRWGLRGWTDKGMARRWGIAGATVSDEPEDQATEMSLVMPFVNVASRGGRYDDDAFAAGWEMGDLDSYLEHQRPAVYEKTIREGNAEQADLIAMHWGYRAATETTEIDEWLTLKLVQVVSEP